LQAYWENVRYSLTHLQVHWVALRLLLLLLSWSRLSTLSYLISPPSCRFQLYKAQGSLKQRNGQFREANGRFAGDRWTFQTRKCLLKKERNLNSLTLIIERYFLFTKRYLLINNTNTNQKIRALFSKVILLRTMNEQSKVVTIKLFNLLIKCDLNSVLLEKSLFFLGFYFISLFHRTSYSHLFSLPVQVRRCRGRRSWRPTVLYVLRRLPLGHPLGSYPLYRSIYWGKKPRRKWKLKFY